MGRRRVAVQHGRGVRSRPRPRGQSTSTPRSWSAPTPSSSRLAISSPSRVIWSGTAARAAGRAPATHPPPRAARCVACVRARSPNPCWPRPVRPQHARRRRRGAGPARRAPAARAVPPRRPAPPRRPPPAARPAPAGAGRRSPTPAAGPGVPEPGRVAPTHAGRVGRDLRRHAPSLTGAPRGIASATASSTCVRRSRPPRRRRRHRRGPGRASATRSASSPSRPPIRQLGAARRGLELAGRDQAQREQRRTAEQPDAGVHVVAVRAPSSAPGAPRGSAG